MDKTYREQLIGFILQVFETFNSELVERTVETKSVVDITVSTRVKDAVRQFAIKDTVEAFQSYILADSTLDDKIIARSL